ncbi:AcvB/VirJ family lysyl-phosphatidylglycerol hydrolase [Pseudomonas sp. NPDC007930]|uniref:virulence factor family protein n=1 Tax=Pseudomonas sp. NPDC007930 TaxID=3364417 RepID=UPI0036E1C68F
MIRRYWRVVLIILVVLLALAGAGYWWWSRPVPAPTLQAVKLTDGSPATQVVPGQSAQNYVLLLVPPEQAMADKQLADVSRQAAARIVQVVLPADCKLQQAAFDAGLKQLGHTPNVVGGIAVGASQAWNWLAGQSNDKAKAVSVDFARDEQTCKPPLAQKADHGHWYVAWNDWPDDTGSLLVRAQPNAENSISDYDVKLPELLKAQLARALLGEAAPTLKMPVVEVPATGTPGDTVTLFLSGDGGWRDLDKDVAGDMAQLGYPVVGIDTLRYYWQHKAPEESAEDLSEVMEYYRHKWNAKHFILAGYSFGADVLPAIYNRLGEDDQKRVDGLILLAFARSGSFEIEVEGWLGQEGKEAPTGPEMAKLPPEKVLCVYGEEETAESGCTDTTAVGQKLKLPGGHHFDENYPALTQKLLAVINGWIKAER